MGVTYVNSPDQYLLRCIMYYSLRYCKEEKQLVELFFTKGVVESVVKVLDKCTYSF